MINILLTQQGGILKPFAWIMGIILDGIYEFISLFGITNLAVCIILFTIVIKMLMLPLTIKQQKFTKLSTKMNPEISAIQEKYKGKKDEASQRRQQAEMQEVYENYGTSPMGGCLPLLITLPIMFALYRVIYKIPGYVGDIYDLYENVVNIIMQIAQGSGSNVIFGNAMANFVTAHSISLKTDITSYEAVISNTNFVNALIDIFSYMNAGKWTSFLNGELIVSDSWNALLTAVGTDANGWIPYLQTTLGDNYLQTLSQMTSVEDLGTLLNISNFSEVCTVKDLSNCFYWNTFALSTDLGSNLALTNASVVVDEILGVNSFLFGMNILDTAGWKIPGIFIPIISVAANYLQSFLMKTDTNTNKSKNANDNPMAQSMTSMTKIMPIMSGIIAIMLPIGVGIYWITSTLVQIIQQLFINKYLDKADIDKMIAKNVEKSNKKKEKLGISTNGNNKMANVAKTSTKTIENDNSISGIAGKSSGKKSTSDYKRQDVSYSAGSIAANARLLADRNKNKNDNTENKEE